MEEKKKWIIAAVVILLIIALGEYMCGAFQDLKELGTIIEEPLPGE